MKYLFAIVALLLLAACASQTITATPQSAIATNKPVVSDFTATAGNLNCAVAIGILPATDPAVMCANDALVKFSLPSVSCVAGVPTVAAPVPGTAPVSFKATNAGLISAGSIMYIKRAQAGAAPITVSPTCEQLFGKLQVDGLSAASNPIGTIENILGLPTFK